MPEVLIPESTIAIVVNKGAKAFKGQWDNQVFTIAPGATSVVPYFAMCSWFGDPRSVNIGDPDADFDKQHRTHAYRMLSAYYGTQNDSWYISVEDHPRDLPAPTVSDAHWINPQTNPAGRPAPTYYFNEERQCWVHPNIPNVECFTDYSKAEKIVTVLDDPFGDHLTPAKAHSVAESRAVEDALHELQRQMSQLQLQQATLRQGLDLDVDFADEGVADAPPVLPDAPSELTLDTTPADTSGAIGATSSGQAPKKPARPQRRA